MYVNDASHACDVFFPVLLLALGCMIRSTHVHVYALRCSDATSAEELLLLRALLLINGVHCSVSIR